MDFQLKSGNAAKQRCGCLVVAVFEGRHLSVAAADLDAASGGFLSTVLARGDLDGRCGQTLMLHAVPDIAAERVLLVGCGKEREFSDQQYRKAVRQSVALAQDSNTSDMLIFLPELVVKNRELHWKIRTVVEVASDVSYCFDQLKSKKDSKPRKLKSIVLNVLEKADVSAGKKALLEAQAIVDGIKETRDVANLPGNICTPTYLAQRAQFLAKTHSKIKCTILDEAELKKMGAGAFVAVSQGSDEDGKLITMDYRGGKTNQAPIVLVGKGITFDTGGISIKPSDGMDEMKFDMGGAASVLGVMSAIASMALPLNVIGVIAAAENMPSGKATRPGDVVTTLSGLTVEILNTDAEGRLVLCDALTYVERFEPETVIDIATLTGACIIALGHQATGLLSNHDALANELLAAGENTGDRAWRLPLWDEYQEQLDSPVADIANIGGRPAGTITAACFLSRFAKKFHWAHLDIAGTAWISGKKKNATGRPVSLLVQFLMDRAHQPPRVRPAAKNKA